MTKPATPLPWQVVEIGAEGSPQGSVQWGAVYGTAPRDCIAAGMRLETAAYIVHACNAYPELVALVATYADDPDSPAARLLARLGEGQP